MVERSAKSIRKAQRNLDWALESKALFLERSNSLVELGFKTYQEYLISPFWKNIRTRVLKEAKDACRLCRRKAWQIHHVKYDLATMKGENIVTLVALCGECHKLIEFGKRGRKASLPEANHRLRRFLRRERWDRKQLGYDPWK